MNCLLIAKRHNFNKYNDSKVDSLNSTYDYKSFMQYSKKAFGINGTITLDPTQKDIFQLGQRVGFTESDQHQAMTLYRCDGKKVWNSVKWNVLLIAEVKAVLFADTLNARFQW